MNYTRLQWSINFKPKHMKFFEDNLVNIQNFTRAAVDEKINKLKENERTDKGTERTAKQS